MSLHQSARDQRKHIHCLIRCMLCHVDYIIMYTQIQKEPFLHSKR